MTEEVTPPTLLRSIGSDIISVGKLPLLLIILVFILAIGVVLVTYDTRKKITYRDTLLEQREELDNEWRNLILEENALSEHTRIQSMAIEELNMKRPDSDKEVTVELP